MLKPYCVKKRKTEQDVVSEHMSAHRHIHHLTDLWQSVDGASSVLLAPLVPGSSWLLSSTWCKHARRPFGSRVGSSWWFCCWKLSRSWKRQDKIQKSDSFFFFLHDIKCLTVASFMYCEWSGVPSFQEWERERENYRQVRLTRKKKKVWGCRCIVGEARFPCRCGRNTCCYVRVLHIHFSSAVYNLPTRHFKVHHVWNIQTHPNRLLPNLRSYKTTERFITKSIMRETVYYQRNTYIVNIHIAVIHLYYFIIFCLILYNEN